MRAVVRVSRRKRNTRRAFQYLPDDETVPDFLNRGGESTAASLQPRARRGHRRPRTRRAPQPAALLPAAAMDAMLAELDWRRLARLVPVRLRPEAPRLAVPERTGTQGVQEA